MDIDTSALREGETIRYTSGKVAHAIKYAENEVYVNEELAKMCTTFTRSQKYRIRADKRKQAIEKLKNIK
jgi:hypothetical protein